MPTYPTSSTILLLCPNSFDILLENEEKLRLTERRLISCVCVCVCVCIKSVSLYACMHVCVSVHMLLYILVHVEAYRPHIITGAYPFIEVLEHLSEVR